MNPRTIAGLLLGLGGVGAVAFGLARLTPRAAPATPAASKQPASGAQVQGQQTGPALSVGVSSGYPPVRYVDTGAADFTTYNRPGWDYAPVGVGLVGVLGGS